MSVTIHVDLNGVRVPLVLDDAALAAVAAAVTAKAEPEPLSELLTVPQAALYIGCGYKPCSNCKGDACRRCHGTGQVVNRQRVDDLLSSGRLERVKDGSRTLIRRSDLDAYLDNGSNGRRRS